MNDNEKSMNNVEKNDTSNNNKKTSGNANSGNGGPNKFNQALGKLDQMNQMKQKAQAGPTAMAQDYLQQKIKASRRGQIEKKIDDGVGSSSPEDTAVAKAYRETSMGKTDLDKAEESSVSTTGAAKKFVNLMIQKKEILKFVLPMLAQIVPLILITLFVVIIFQSAAAMFYSWIPDIFKGSNIDGIPVAESGKEGEDESSMLNPANNFYTILKAIDEEAIKLEKEWGVEIDKNLIAATLLGPVDNSIVVNKDGENLYINPNTGEQVEWKTLQKLMQEQVSFLAKAQVINVQNNQDNCKESTGFKGRTSRQYALNDLPVNTWNFGYVALPWKWFETYNDKVTAEKNYKCNFATDELANTEEHIPVVRVTSYEMGYIAKEYFKDPAGNNMVNLLADPNTGGVYFWNLVNPDGFIYNYYQGYLGIDTNDTTPEQGYERNKSRIFEIAEEIYLFYDGMSAKKLYCNGYKLIENKTQQIFAVDPDDPCAEKRPGTNIITSIDNCEMKEPEYVEFENPDDLDEPIKLPKCQKYNTGLYDLEFYVAGVMSKEFSSAYFEINENDSTYTTDYYQFGNKKLNIEAQKAMAILARTYALSRMESQGYVATSSNNQNFAYNWRGCMKSDEVISYQNSEGDIELLVPIENINFKNSSSSMEILAAAAKATDGLVLTKYDSDEKKVDIFASEYDAFCPTTSTPVNGYYHFTEGQRGLPIEAGWVEKKGKALFPRWNECPCDPAEYDYSGNSKILYSSSSTVHPGKYASDCYKRSSSIYDIVTTDDNGNVVKTEYAWTYKPIGGHGRGISQEGMLYYVQRGYDMLEVLKLFEDRDNNPVTLMKTTGSVGEKECIGVEVENKTNTSSETENSGEETTTDGEKTYTGKIKVTKTSKILSQDLKTFLNKKEPDGFNKFNVLLENSVKEAGWGTRAGVVAWANTLIGYLDDNYKVKIPYHWGRGWGGHSTKPKGYAYKDWGKPLRSRSNPYNKWYTHDGMDCTAFVSAAIYLGGFKHTNGSAATLPNTLGGKTRKLSTCNVKAGDVLWQQGHVMLVMKVSGTSVWIAHAKGGDYGVLIEKKNCRGDTANWVVDMTKWYSKNARKEPKSTEESA